MFLRSIIVAMVAFLAAALPAHSSEYSNIQLQSQVEALFAGNRDIAEIKLTIDRLTDPAVNVAEGLKEIARLEADLDRMAAGQTDSLAKLAILKHFVYQAGPWNLETTSGAGFTRDSHYRKNLPMTNAAVASGIYLRGLSRDETIGMLATELVSHFPDEGRFEDAIVASDVILKHAPKSADVLVKRGSAYAGILRRDIISKYKSMSEMDPETKAYADGLYRANLAGCAAAEALGWRQQDGQL